MAKWRTEQAANFFDVGGQGFVRSNGGNQVLLHTLSLAASTLARSPWEKDGAAWLGERAFFAGMGTGYVNLLEWPWSPVPEEAAQQRKFLRQTVELAQTGHRWEVLPYAPALDLAHESLREFRALLDVPALTEAGRHSSWNFDGPDSLQFCGRHGLYHSALGCSLCLDE